MSSNRLIMFLYNILVRKLLSLRLDECSGSLAFRRYIVRSLMHSVNGVNPSAPQAGPRPRLLDEVRNHYLSRNDKQARCRLCMKNCRMKCTKCDVLYCTFTVNWTITLSDAWCEHLLLWHHLAINFLVKLIAQFIILRMCLYICIHSIVKI